MRVSRSYSVLRSATPKSTYLFAYSSINVTWAASSGVWIILIFFLPLNCLLCSKNKDNNGESGLVQELTKRRGKRKRERERNKRWNVRGSNTLHSVFRGSQVFLSLASWFVYALAYRCLLSARDSAFFLGQECLALLERVCLRLVLLWFRMFYTAEG